VTPGLDANVQVPRLSTIPEAPRTPGKRFHDGCEAPDGAISSLRHRCEFQSSKVPALYPTDMEDKDAIREGVHEWLKVMPSGDLYVHVEILRVSIHRLSVRPTTLALS